MTHPSDINWYMIRNRKSRPWGAQILFNLLAIAILIFVTTPTTLLNVVSRSNGLKNFLALNWIDQSSDFNRYLVQDLAPALIVLGINELLVMVMNFLVDFERKERFSRHQRGQMRKTFFYFFFNMILIPGLAVTAITNIYELVENGVDDTQTFFKKLFVLKNGTFYMALLLGNAGGGFLAGMNVLYILAFNYFSPSISMESKVIERENEKWLKNNDMLFSWGVYYSLNIVIMGIGFVFQ